MGLGKFRRDAKGVILIKSVLIATFDHAHLQGSDFEKEGCKSVPWAHNAFVDETYSPLNGVYYQLNPGDRPAIAAK